MSVVNFKTEAKDPKAAKLYHRLISVIEEEQEGLTPMEILGAIETLKWQITTEQTLLPTLDLMGDE